MRILLISDIHANAWALHAVERDAGEVDQILCAGDTVNYGPRPGAVLDQLRRLNAVTVRGNHDHAVAFAVDPKASPAKQPLALVMRDWTRRQLEANDLGWLLSLKRRLTPQYAGCRFMLVHGTPLDPLYDYRMTPGASDKLLDELTQGVKADVLLAGHTHLPLLRKHRDLTIVNPGSVGQPLDGDPRRPTPSGTTAKSPCAGSNMTGRRQWTPWQDCRWTTNWSRTCRILCREAR